MAPENQKASSQKEDLIKNRSVSMTSQPFKNSKSSQSYSESGSTWTEFSTESYSIESQSRGEVFTSLGDDGERHESSGKTVSDNASVRNRKNDARETVKQSGTATSAKTATIKDKTSTWSRLKKTFSRRAVQKEAVEEEREPPAEPPEAYRRRHRSSIAMGSLYEFQVKIIFISMIVTVVSNILCLFLKCTP